ncbi:hypothetical protein [Actinokineospora bangkokensis]|uniref:Uncharacterized protein n=1 Tax=Actinokineospora bangkokensis TaxID=1193682 RepID=A0A1Q9LIP4_9PSEU|nr:hypothetical protein [Actinokineospora bangkokensis]OLR91849.1 hypothetical protein BJP25_23715 [Actinokineospora bangkokensis]
MATKSLRFVLVANWVFACFLAFTALVFWDEDTPLPVQGGVVVGAWDKGRPAGEVRADVERFALEHHITMGRMTSELDGGRTLYLVDGDPAVGAGEWLQGRYTDFSHSARTVVRPFDEAGEREPTGRYVVFGSDGKAAELTGFFTTHGLTVTRSFTRWSLDPRDLLIQDSQLVALGMMVLVSVAVAAAGVLVGARAYGVNRLHGVGYRGLLGNDLRQIGTWWAGSGAVALVAATGALSFYNGLSNFGLYLVVALAIGAALVAAAVCAHALVLLLMMRLRVLAAVKGELPGRSAAAVAYVLRVVTVIATVVLVQQAISTGLDLGRRSEVFAAYQRAGATSKVSLGNVWSQDDQQAIRARVGSWLRAEDQGGHLLLAGRQYLQGAGSDLVFVNDNFLRDQPVRLADGASFVPDRPTALIPPQLWGRRDEVLAGVRENPSLGPDVAFAAVKSAGSDVFTYTSAGVGPAQARSDDNSFATDPVLVYLPSRMGLLTDYGYMAFASQARVLFPDPAAVTSAVDRDPALGAFVVGVTPIADQAAAEQRSILQDFRLALFSSLAGVLVLLITGVGAVLIHTRRNAQWIFARHVSGWRFTAVHRSLLAFEAVVTLVVLGWLPYQAWKAGRDLDEYRALGIPAPFEATPLGAAEWAATGTLAALTAGGVLISLARAHHRVVRDGASEA